MSDGSVERDGLCGRVREELEKLVLERRLEEELPPRIRSHVEVCASCRLVLERERALLERFEELDVSVCEPQERLLARILGTLREDRERDGVAGVAGRSSAERAASRWRELLPRVAFCAVLLLVVGGWAAGWFSRPGADVDSSLVFVVSWADGGGESRVRAPAEVVASGGGETVARADGRFVCTLSAGGGIRLEENGSVTLLCGLASFVAHGPMRVGCGPCTVEVVGTVFAVEKLSRGVGVEVEEGLVKVSSVSGEVRLVEGGRRVVVLDDGRFADAETVSSGRAASGRKEDSGGTGTLRRTTEPHSHGGDHVDVNMDTEAVDVETRHEESSYGF